MREVVLLARRKRETRGTQFDLTSFMEASKKKAKTKSREEGKEELIRHGRGTNTKKAIANFLSVWGSVSYSELPNDEKIAYLTDVSKLVDYYIDNNIYDIEYYKEEINDEHSLPGYLRDIYLAKRMIEQKKYREGVDPRARIWEVCEKLSFDNKFSFKFRDSFVEFIKRVDELRSMLGWK